ncbi:hypothetical protein B0H13DRAFT_2678337 [Mycena leptocephala]|nr:hypothetical protein B0H13DRAFT_2678337 [Mycena leptocephala]
MPDLRNQSERPSVQLSQLEDTAKKTEVIIRDAKVVCLRDLLSLTEEGTIGVDDSMSPAGNRDPRLEEVPFTLARYRALCDGRQENQTTVQLIVEAERQRKFTEDINAAGTILTSVRSPDGGVLNIRPIFLAFIKDPTASSHCGFTVELALDAFLVIERALGTPYRAISFFQQSELLPYLLCCIFWNQ